MWQFFTDPVLAATTIGCMLMSMIAAIVGAFSVLRKQSLVGEALSHACYPGVILSLIILRLFFSSSDDLVSAIAPLIGAAFSCIVGMYLINLLENRFKVPADAALCVVLASFFGIGLALLSSLQGLYPTLYRQLQSYLFGQAATMTEIHAILYPLLALFVLLLVVIFYRPIKMVIFDIQFAAISGVNTRFIHFLLLFITVLAVVTGIRSVGVVLMSAMLIFPSVCARQWTDRLSWLLFLSALFGLLCGYFGVYFSHTMSFTWMQDGKFVAFPTGPMIVITATVLFVLSSCFAPRSGLCVRAMRQWYFWNRCQQENLLKMIWKLSDREGRTLFSVQEIRKLLQIPSYLLQLLLFSAKRKGWLRSVSREEYELTTAGAFLGRKIVRLHRLWELYLVEYCGVAKDRVHPSAEQMEHIITPEVEKELSIVLHDPVTDPHKQPIPR